MMIWFYMLIALLISIIVGLLVRNRQLHRQINSTKEVKEEAVPVSKEPVEEPATPSTEEVFRTRLEAAMEKNMSNKNLTVEQLVEEMGMGRTAFFTRLKSTLGVSPVEYIRETRIRRAAQLLKEPGLTISEVSSMVGMNDSRYFSKCFKHTYGVTPTEWKRG